MKFCTSCGAQVHDQAVVCVNCGSTISASAPAKSNNMKFCPNCGNQCLGIADICVNCGYSFSSSAKKKSGQNNSSPAATVVSIIAIILAVIGLISAVINVFNLFVNGYGRNQVLSVFGGLLTGILVLVGFIKRKNNPIPGVAYIISAVLSLLNIVINLFTYEYFDFLSLLSIVSTILLALLYLNKKPSGRKLWFLPVILTALVTVISIIVQLADGYFEYSYSYYYSSFNTQLFIIYLATGIGSVFGILVTSLNAKLNWFVDAGSVQAANPVPDFAPVQQYADTSAQQTYQDTNF